MLPRRRTLTNTGKRTPFAGTEVRPKDVGRDPEVLQPGVGLTADDFPDRPEGASDGPEQKSVGDEGHLDRVVDEIDVDGVGHRKEEDAAEVSGDHNSDVSGCGQEVISQQR